MKKQKQIQYRNKVLTYDRKKSGGMIVPIYSDMDGRLYMPLDNRFVTVNEVIEAIEAYQTNQRMAM